MKKEELTNLENLQGGAAVELFNDAWSIILKNIADPNTKAEAVRVVTLKVEVKPKEGNDGSRAYGQVKTSVSTKLAPPRPAETIIYIAPDGSGASESNLKQPKLEYTDENGNVKAIGPTLVGKREIVNG